MLSTLPIKPIGPSRGTPVLEYTIRGFVKSGWQVHFLAGFKPEPEYDLDSSSILLTWFSLDKLVRLSEIRKLGYFFRFLLAVGYFGCFLLKGIKVAFREDVDLIYAWDPYSSVPGKVLSLLFGKPLVTRILGTSLKEKDLNIFYKIRRWHIVLSYKFHGSLIVMTNDGTQGDKVLRKLGIDMQKVRFWMNGVDRDHFRVLPNRDVSRERLKVRRRHVLLCISRLANWKRVDRSINALPRVIERHPDTILIVVGDGSERKRLEKLAAELGVLDYVRFEGAVPHHEIPKYYAAADIFLSFYDWSNVGNPLLEAMMSGKCIVTLNNGCLLYTSPSPRD